MIEALELKEERRGFSTDAEEIKKDALQDEQDSLVLEASERFTVADLKAQFGNTQDNCFAYCVENEN